MSDSERKERWQWRQFLKASFRVQPQPHVSWRDYVMSLLIIVAVDGVVWTLHRQFTRILFGVPISLIYMNHRRKSKPLSEHMAAALAFAVATGFGITSGVATGSVVVGAIVGFVVLGVCNNLMPELARTEKPQDEIAKWNGRETSDEFLWGRAWRTLRYKVLCDRGARCECCGATPADGLKINVDHIKPRKHFPELALDETNLQVLCEACNHGKGNWDQTDWRGSDSLHRRRRS